MNYKQVIVLFISIVFGIAACIGAFFLGKTVIGESIDPTLVATAVVKAPEVVVETEKIPETVIETETETETEEFSDVHVSEEDPNEVYRTKNVNFRRIVVADELSVRVNSIADAERIGVLYYGDEIKVTGIVMCNDEEIGWARVDYNGQVGYVASEYLAEAE